MKNGLRFAALALLTAALVAVSFSLGFVIFAEKSVFAVKSEASYSPADEGVERLTKNAALAEVAAMEPDDRVYVLREHNGRVGIFLPGEDIPLRILDVYVFTLPEEVARELRPGIRCDSAVLGLYIEAFTS